MTNFGNIVALLNQEQLLLEILDDYVGRVVVGEKLVVFAIAHNDVIASLGLPGLYAPKGEIRIVMRQAGNFFLAERFKEGGRVERRPVAGIDFFTQEVRIGGKWSAEINQDEILGIDFDREIRLGDVVGVI